MTGLPDAQTPKRRKAALRTRDSLDETHSHRPGGALSRPDARWMKTRQALLDAGQHLFSVLSEDGVSIDDIVRQARVAKGSFYNHFVDKDALAKEIYHQLRLDIEARIVATNAGVEDPARRSCRALCTYARIAIDNPQQARLIARLITDDMSTGADVNQGVTADTTQALRAGRYNIPSVDSGVVLKIGLAHAVITRLLNGADRFEAVTVAQQLCTLKLRALGLEAVEAEMIAAQSADEIVRPELDLRE